MCVPLVLAKQKKSKEVKWAREFYFEKSRKRPNRRKKEKGTRNRVFFFFFFFTILPQT